MFFVKKSTYTSLLSRMEEVSNDLATIQGELTLEKNKTAHLEAEIVKSDNKANGLQSTINLVRKDYKESIDKVRSLERTSEDQQVELQMLSKELEKSKEAYENIRSKEKSLLKELAEAKKKESEMSKAAKALSVSLDIERNGKKLIEDSIPGYESTITSLNDTVTECKNELSNVLKELGTARKEIEVLKGKKGGKR